MCHAFGKYHQQEIFILICEPLHDGLLFSNRDLVDLPFSRSICLVVLLVNSFLLKMQKNKKNKKQKTKQKTVNKFSLLYKLMSV